MSESTQTSTAREVVTARQLYWVTIIAGCMVGPPPPRGSAAGVILLLVATAWVVLIVVINIRTMRRSGLNRSGLVAPILTALFVAAIVLNVWHLAAEMGDTFGAGPPSQ
ncbi:hypothetical protein AYO47_02850 [Planctomyces sp. SCGC AG-212-M04]|nr:hypothetical protein AYO47_02850 [Planctomyces sp. SCGC AG-212-M04]